MNIFFRTFSLFLLISFNANAEVIKNKLKNELTSNTNSYLNSTLGKIFPTAEVSLSSGTSDKVTGSILFVSPLSDINNKENTLFTQGSIYFSDDNRETLNLGIGNRKLLINDKLMLGANIFYDNEIDYGHKRASFGVEAISSVGSLRANQYYAISGAKDVGDSQEKALDGSDIEVGVPLPYLPWTNFYLRTFEWKGVDGVADLKGDEMSLEAKLPLGLNLAVGKRSNDGLTEDQEFIKLTWTCCNNKEQDFGISDKAYSLTSVADQRFQKVRRQNLIVKQSDLTLSIIGF
jgi:adhesin/invasin